MRFFNLVAYMSMLCLSEFGFALEKSPKVVVIGAGIAGLTAAYRLQNGGMNVHLYEARHRVGGRIFTAKINGRIAELGGQNIGDGGDATNLRRLIEEFDLQLASSRVYLRHSYFNGSNLIPVNDLIKERKFDAQILREQIKQLSITSHNMREVLEKMFNADDPLYKVLSVRLAAFEGGTVEKLSPLYEETLFHMLLGGICAVHQKNQEEDAYVDLITISGGNASLPEKIASALGDKLHLNMALSKVGKRNDTFQLTFQNGEQIEADILVLTIPCSVYESINFEDHVIPVSTLEHIRNIQYGENAKIMVPFDGPSQTSGVVDDKIVSFFDVNQRLLTIYYTGATSLFSSETITAAYKQARPMIEAAFGGTCPLYETPIYADDLTNLSYARPVGYSWLNDQYAKGTYSYIASSQEGILTSTIEKNGEKFKTLFAPVQNQLYFAGEHASILSEVPGTMEAACESGERTARIILKAKALDLML